MNSIYTPRGYNATYSSLLNTLYNVNNLLKRDGIMAPSDDSVRNTRKLYDLIGRPLDRIPTIHVGGTNGKGSTSFKIAEILRRNGIRTGLFVSPHLASIRERVQVNAELISETEFCSSLPKILDLCVKSSVPATFFELSFLLACLHYEASSCEAVVLEVGLGGELDATNVVSTALSVICSVSLDHTRVLGSTVEAIAQKKAGIFKKGVPALLGPGVPMQVMQEVATTNGATLYTLDEALARFDSKPILDSIHTEERRDVTSSSVSIEAAKTGAAETATAPGFGSAAAIDSADFVDTDELNAKISLAALHLMKTERGGVFSSLDLAAPVTLAALCARPPCRWEQHFVTVHRPSEDQSSGSGDGGGGGSAGSVLESVIKKRRRVDADAAGAAGGGTGAAHESDAAEDADDAEAAAAVVEVVLDVGHNPAAIEALVMRLRRCYAGRHIHMLYAMSRDKDVRTCLRRVLDVVPTNCIHFAQSDNFRAISRVELQALFKECTGQDMVDIDAANVRETVAQVIRLAAEEGSRLGGSQPSVVVVCGTGYIMPDARAVIGIIEPRDDEDLKREDAPGDA